MYGSEGTYCKLTDEGNFRPKIALIQKYVVKHYFGGDYSVNLFAPKIHV
jgi:hypothetical protein